MPIGCLNYKRMFLRNPLVNLVEAVAATTSDSDPLYQRAVVGECASADVPGYVTDNHVPWVSDSTLGLVCVYDRCLGERGVGCVVVSQGSEGQKRLGLRAEPA